MLIKNTKFWDKTKNLIECYSIETINGSKAGDYEKNFMKIKFNSDYNLPLNQILEIDNMTIVIRYFFREDKKYYPQVFFR